MNRLGHISRLQNLFKHIPASRQLVWEWKELLCEPLSNALHCIITYIEGVLNIHQLMNKLDPMHALVRLVTARMNHTKTMLPHTLLYLLNSMHFMLLPLSTFNSLFGLFLFTLWVCLRIYVGCILSARCFRWWLHKTNTSRCKGVWCLRLYLSLLY